jgi:hypothetical protein
MARKAAAKSKRPTASAAPPTASEPRNQEQIRADQELRRREANEAHRRRQLKAIDDKGFAVEGVRMTIPGTDRAEGMVVTFHPEEAEKLGKAVRQILSARKE